MTSTDPRLTEQQLDEYEALARTVTLLGAEIASPGILTRLVAEIRRLRARTLTEAEHDRAWHAIEGTAGEEGADPGTVLNAVLRALGLNPPTEETHVVADGSDDPEHIDDCPGCTPAR